MGRVGFVPPSFLLHVFVFFDVVCICLHDFFVFFGFGGVGVAVLSKNTHSPGMRTWQVSFHQKIFRMSECQRTIN